MAGVNNQPNLKPLIDNQSTAQRTELTAVAQAINAGVDTAKTELVAESNSVKAAVNAAKTLITDDAQVKADELVSAVLSGKNATEQLFSELALEVEALKAELQLVKNIADFDIRNLTAAKSLQSNGELKKYSINTKPNTINELVYSRGGSGAIVLLNMGNYVSGRVIADGVVFDLGESVNVPAKGFDYIKYMNSISIELSNRHPASSISCYFSDSEVS